MADGVMNVVWTEKAIASLDEIVAYLLETWSEKEVQKFLAQLTQILDNIKRYPGMCRPSLKKKDIRLGILNKHTRLVYSHRPGRKQIVILLLWNTRRNPADFNY